MADQEPWTIQRLLNWTVDYLSSKQAAHPRLDAEVLLANSLGCQRIELYTRFSEVPGEEPLSKFRGLVKERATGKPVAYLVGHKEFYSLAFEVTPAVLIPRPESEYLVLEAKDAGEAWQVAHPDEPLEFLDVGTGSGCLAVALATEFPQTRVIATDVSSAALEVAARNAARHDVEDRIEFQQRDVLADWPSQRQVAIVVSNPPYVSPDERSVMDRDVLEFEPEVALFAEEAGLAIIRRLIEEAVPVVRPGGWMFVEISPFLAERVQQLVESHPGWLWAGIRQDLDKHPRVAKMQAISERP